MRFAPLVPGTVAYEAAAAARRPGPRPALADPAQLTDLEREALAKSTTRLGNHAKNVHKTPRERLIAAGWLRLDGRVVRTTEAGRRAMNAVIPEHEKPNGTVEDVLLQHGHGLTTVPARAVHDAGVVIDPATLDTRHARDAGVRHADCSDTKAAARALRDLARAPGTLREDIAAMKRRQRRPV